MGGWRSSGWIQVVQVRGRDRAVRVELGCHSDGGNWGGPPRLTGVVPGGRRSEHARSEHDHHGLERPVGDHLLTIGQVPLREGDALGLLSGRYHGLQSPSFVGFDTDNRNLNRYLADSSRTRLTSWVGLTKHSASSSITSIELV